jgi:hypothetical protein
MSEGCRVSGAGAGAGRAMGEARDGGRRGRRGRPAARGASPVMHCTCCGQWTIEAVEFAVAARGRNGRWLRLRFGDAVVGEYRTPAELIQGLQRWRSAPALADFADGPAPR